MLEKTDVGKDIDESVTSWRIQFDLSS
jgi:hypothetical protein